MKLTPPNITPGEWRAEGENVLSSKGEVIATCPPVFIFGEEKANVQAIAALPDLLKALEMSIPFVVSHAEKSGGDGSLTIAAIKDALTKAGYTIES